MRTTSLHFVKDVVMYKRTVPNNGQPYDVLSLVVTFEDGKGEDIMLFSADGKKMDFKSIIVEGEKDG